MTIDDLHNLSNEIEQVLRDEPPARDNDQYLTVRVWQRFYGIGDKIHVNLLYYLPSELSIRRIRAMIQNTKHMYVPTCEAIARKRRINMELWEQYTRRDIGPSY